jgi:hypothetical protein
MLEALNETDAGRDSVQMIDSTIVRARTSLGESFRPEEVRILETVCERAAVEVAKIRNTDAATESKFGTLVMVDAGAAAPSGPATGHRRDAVVANTKRRLFSYAFLPRR